MTSPGHPVEIEVFRHLFESIPDQMGVTLTRAAFSPNIKERRDHSSAIFDGAGELMAQAAHIPVHLGSMPLSVRAAIEAIDFEPGCHVVLNDPYQGGTHLPDLTLISPVFLENHSAPCFYVANRAHHADVGGITPGSLPLSRHIDQEGVRITPSILDEALIESFSRASRTPLERRGDLAAQTAANRVGVRRLVELAGKYGLATLEARAGDLNAYAARLMCDLIRDIPDGSYQAEDYLDDDGFDQCDVPIIVDLVVDGEKCCFDFSRSADQLPGPLNAVRAITMSAVFYVMRCLASEHMPTNAGCLRPIQVITRPGSVVDARYPAPVAAGNVETSQRLVDVLLRALAKALPGRIPAASAGSMNNVTMGNADSGAPFVYYETIGGGAGAGPSWHGESGVQVHMTNTLNTPVEVLEHSYPLRIRRYGLRSGSGGKGRYTGGLGLVREYEFLRPTRVTLLAERHRTRPYGLEGGEPGQAGCHTLIDQDGSETHLDSKTSLVCQPGQGLRVETAGGGGYGLFLDTKNQGDRDLDIESAPKRYHRAENS